ncbi:non-ribosomal peptide synthetase [Micromonospora marina]|uniref:Phenyloxazoline synthase MbtB n=1 Tax=Micromonospora marina TaxID=307120 RepID=A0A1C5A7Q0_9ACTN|nr:non-ribosomal peptide synthetase [Micromonospora marina]SCF41186.1 pyochelin synthetase [Micromonospora marina]
MNASTLIADFAAKGIRLWEEDGQLRFRAVQGALTDERKALLRANKEAVLAALRDQRDRSVLTPDPENRHEPFPLTDIQGAYLVGRTGAYPYGNVPCQTYVELAFPAGTDAGRLVAAWHAVVQRHDMLRAIVHRDGYQQVLADPTTPHIPVADLRGQDSDLVGAAIERVRRELSEHVAVTDRWPLHEVRVTVTDTELLLHLSVDLLVVDYASLQRVLAEVEDLYHGEQLPALDATFRDYVLARRGQRQTPAYARDRDYWLGRIDALPGAPDLPVTGDPYGPATFAHLAAAIDPQTWAAIQNRAAAHGVSVSSAVLAAYAEVVGRWSRNPRFLLNVPVFDRLPLHPDVGRLVGDFTAVELLEVDLTASRPFADRVREINGTLLEDLAHPLFSGSDVLAELTRRSESETVLMPVVFTSTLGSATTRQTRAAVRHAVSRTPQVWLDCQVMERAGGLSLSWDVRDGVLAGDTAADMFEAFVVLVGTLADEETWTAPATVRLPARTARVRAKVNATEAPAPAGLLTDAVVATAARTPDAVAVRSGDASLTYRELLDRAAVVAQALDAHGIGSGELVAVTMEKGWEQVAGVLGVLLAGGAYLPVDLTQPPLRRQAILSDAAVRVTLTQSWLTAELELPAGVQPIAVDTLPPTGAPIPTPVTDPADLAYVIYTSGSTGTPKGVMISHRAALNTVADINQRFTVGSGDRILALAQLGFDLSVYDIFGVLAAGGTVVLPDPARRGDPSAWAETVAAEGVTLWNSVPSQLQMLHDYLSTTPDRLPSLRLAMLSGDWIPLQLPDQIRALLPGLEVHSLGGATEASIWSIHFPIGAVNPGWASIPYGTPLLNQTFDVLDSAMRPCPDHVVGELYIGGLGLADGYLGDPRRTAERFVTHPDGRRLYRTGDLGRYRPDGIIEFLGRADHQVKIRGYRIELGEIQAVLDAVPAVGASAVVVEGESGAAAQAALRRLAAFVEPARITPPPVPAAVTAALRLTVPDGDTERLVAFYDAFHRAALMSVARIVAGRTGSTDQLCDELGVHDRHRRLVHRWVASVPDGPAPSDGDLAAAWDRAEALEKECGWSQDLFAAVRACSEQLLPLLRAEIEVGALLSPEAHEDAYRGNAVSRVLHGTLADTVRALADAHSGTLRIVEVGVRSGGAAADLLPALAGYDVDYLCTDSSPLRLAASRNLIGDDARFATLDLGGEFRQQGFQPGSADVVICASVLNNSADVDAALTRLRELVAPGGWMLILENTDDASPAVRISTEFLAEHAGPFTDARAAAGQSFLEPRQWTDALHGVGGEVVAELPADGSPLARAGQRLFAVRLKADRSPVDLAALTRHAAARLPEYMVPAVWQVVDALPTTANGKIDRAALLSWLAPDGAAPQADEQPVDELEIRLAQLWQELLGIERVGRNDDLFALGGDSLLVARLVGQLREGLDGLPGDWDLEWEIVLRHLLRTPTVAGLAAYLRDNAASGTAGSQDTVSPVVRLIDDLSGPVTVLVHAGTGTLLPYRPLITEIRRAGGRNGLLGLEIPALDEFLNADPDGLVDRLAAQYATALLDTGAREFDVVGYCVGGIIATEVARGLAESGATVRSLTVISSHSPSFRIDDDLLSEYSFALMMGMDLATIGFPTDDERVGAAAGAVLAASPGAIANGSLADLEGEFADVAAAFAALESMPRMRRVARMVEALPPDLAGSYEPEGLLRTLRTYQQSIFALSRHRTEPYAGDITFLRHNGAYPFPGSATTITEHWAKLCLGDLSSRDIPGQHFTCMTGAHVSTVFGHLTQLVDGLDRA